MTDYYDMRSTQQERNRRSSADMGLKIASENFRAARSSHSHGRSPFFPFFLLAAATLCITAVTQVASQDVTEFSGGESAISDSAADGDALSDHDKDALAAWFSAASWHDPSNEEDPSDHLPPIDPDNDDIIQQARIVGGSAISSGESYPYVVLLAHNGGVKCAGSLIGPKVVLSAGHCAGADTVYVQAKGGSSDDSYGFHSYSVRRETRHPSFESPGKGAKPGWGDRFFFFLRYLLCVDKC